MNTELGDRMKGYELASRLVFPRRLPLIIRIDGKSFHTMTRRWRCEKPFDPRIVNAMHEATKVLCKAIQGAEMAYVQSDEISVLVEDDQSIEAQAWFSKELQKVVSVSASVATQAFNEILAQTPGATFDSRAFILPPHEVFNYFWWRQQDATRNAVAAVAQAHFSPRQLHQKNTPAMMDMLQEKGITLDSFPTHLRRGAFVLYELFEKETEHGMALRSRWRVDLEPPKLLDDREYLERVKRRNVSETPSDTSSS